jgi:hypothetical protein
MSRMKLRELLRQIGAAIREEVAAERDSLVGAEFVRAGHDGVWRVALHAGSTVQLRCGDEYAFVGESELDGPLWHRLERIHGTTPTQGEA